MLNKREIDILNMLIIQDNVNIYYLCDFFKVSKRSIQYNISNINYYLKKENFDKISIKNNNVSLSNGKDIEKFLNIMKKNNDIEKIDRIDLIYLYAVFNKNGLNISNLSSELNISRNTLKADMQYLNNENLIYRHSKGYFLEMSNKKKIELFEKISKKENIAIFLEKVLDNNLIENIKKFLKEVSSSIKLILNEEVYQKLIVFIYCHITFPENNDFVNRFNVVEEFSIIEKIYLKYFNNTQSLNVVSDMIIGLSLELNIVTWLDESFLINKMIKKVSDKINIDLTSDNILYDFLLSHIKVSIYRLKKDIKLTNPVYQKLIDEEDEILEIIKEVIVEIEDIFNIRFTEMELSLIGFHFKASIDRMQINNRKKVILVCGLGYGTSRLLEYNLKENFDIDIVDVLPAYMLSKELVLSKNVDYILTTVDLEYSAIKINPLLENEDYEKLNKIGIKRKKEKIFVDEFLENIEEFGNFDRKKLKKFLIDKYNGIFASKYNKNSALLNSINSENVIFKKMVKNWKEAIEILGNNLKKRNSITEEYIEEMINMIEKLGPYIVIGDGIAIPHAKHEKGVIKTDFSIMILEEPVLFKNKKVYILFSFASIDDSSHLDILTDFYKVISLPEFLISLKEIKNYEQFRKYLEDKI